MRNRRPTIAGGLMVLMALAIVPFELVMLFRSADPFVALLWLLAGIVLGAAAEAATFRWAYLGILAWIPPIILVAAVWFSAIGSFAGGVLIGLLLIWFPHCWEAVGVRPSRRGVWKGLAAFRETHGADREAGYELLERLMTLRRWPEAEEVARSLADTDELFPTFALTTTLLNRGDAEQGVQLLNRFAAAHPDDARPHIQLALHLLSVDPLDPRAKDAADQAWARCGRDTEPSWIFELAWIYAKWTDRRSRAIPLLKMVIDEGSVQQSTNAHALLSEILRGTDNRAAEAHRARARSTVPRRFRGNLEAQLRWIRKTLDMSSGAPQEPAAT